MVIVLVFVAFSSGVLSAQFFSLRIISNEPLISNEPSWDFRAKKGIDWFQKWNETYKWSQEQNGGLVEKQAEISNNYAPYDEVNVQAAVNVGLYWDANCSVPVSFLDWGTISQGSVKNITIFIRNEGNAPSSLFLKATNWNPVNASDFLVLSWDYSNYLVYPRQTIKVLLTLAVASFVDGIDDFSFDLVISFNG